MTIDKMSADSYAGAPGIPVGSVAHSAATGEVDFTVIYKGFIPDGAGVVGLKLADGSEFVLNNAISGAPYQMLVCGVLASNAADLILLK